MQACRERVADRAGAGHAAQNAGAPSPSRAPPGDTRVTGTLDDTRTRTRGSTSLAVSSLGRTSVDDVMVVCGRYARRIQSSQALALPSPWQLVPPHDQALQGA